MKVAWLCVALVCGIALSREAPKLEADLDDSVSWMEPEYAQADALVEAASKVRGVVHTVAPKKGMVTYISPARHLAMSGIVLNPSPHVEIVQSTPPQVVVEAVTPVVEAFAPVILPPHHHHHAFHLHGHHHGHHEHHLAPEVHEELHHHGHDHHDLDWIHDPRVRLHRHHRFVHPATHHVHVNPPMGIPSSLLNQPPHQPHYLHKSHSLSFGTPMVPVGTLGVEEPAFTGYNPGPPIQTNSVPTGFYSDGTPYPTSMRRYGGH